MPVSRILPVLALALLLTGGCATPAHAEIVEGSFTPVGADTQARFFHAASVLDDGRVLVTGGMRLQLIPPSLVSLDAGSVYDPVAQTFSATFTPDGGAPVAITLATARSSHTQTTMLDGRVVVTGGATGASGTSPGTPIASVEIFDPATGLFTPGPSMSSPRTAHTATRLPDGRLVVAGGATWQVLNAGATAWEGPFALAHTRTGHAAVRLADHAGPGAHRVLLVAGNGNGATTMELLDPDAGATTVMTAQLAVGVDDLAAVRLDDGAVLIVGGQDLGSGDTIDDCYLYDVTSDRLVVAPSPPNVPDGVQDHELLALERFAFMFGGERQLAGDDLELTTAAIYDRAAGDWIWTGAMLDPHDDFASAALDDGTIVLIDGGAPFLGQEAPTNKVEVFTPTTLRPADVDGSGSVEFPDLLAILATWGPCPSDDCPTDLDFDGAVAFTDLLVVLAAWGSCG